MIPHGTPATKGPAILPEGSTRIRCGCVYCPTSDGADLDASGCKAPEFRDLVDSLANIPPPNDDDWHPDNLLLLIKKAEALLSELEGK